MIHGTILLGGNRARLGDYIRELADLMGLRDWQFRLADDPPDPSDDTENQRAGAQCDVTFGRQYATIAIADDWAMWDPDELRQTICHELLHCHTQKMLWAIESFDTQFPVPVMLLFQNTFRTAHEMTVDPIAVAWSRSLPLPQEG